MNITFDKKEAWRYLKQSPLIILLALLVAACIDFVARKFFGYNYFETGFVTGMLGTFAVVVSFVLVCTLIRGIQKKYHSNLKEDYKTLLLLMILYGILCWGFLFGSHIIGRLVIPSRTTLYIAVHFWAIGIGSLMGILEFFLPKRPEKPELEQEK